MFSPFVFDTINDFFQSLLSGFVEILPSLGWVLVVIIVTIIINKIIENRLEKFLKGFKMSSGNIQIFQLIATWGVIFVAALFILSILELQGLVTSLIAGAGVTSVIVAFGTQDISKNVVSGLFIIGGKSFEIGDYIIDAEGNEGMVRKITIRAVILEAMDGRVITVPSAVLFSKPVTNLTGTGRRRVLLDYQLVPDIEIEKVEEEILGLLEEQSSVHKRPKPEILITNITNKYYNFQVLYWTNSSPMQQLRSQGEVNLSLSKYFQKKEYLSEWIRKG